MVAEFQVVFFNDESLALAAAVKGGPSHVTIKTFASSLLSLFPSTAASHQP